MSAAFTPGPWEAVEADDRHQEDVVPIKAGKHTVCEVEGWPTNHHPLMTVAEAEANARLIAAAPDYDAFAASALPLLEVLHSTCQSADTRKTVWSCILAGRAALAKAKGGEA